MKKNKGLLHIIQIIIIFALKKTNYEENYFYPILSIIDSVPL